jgi:short-subunit dehydrogenase
VKTQSTALITGASSGIGAIYADRFARRGCDLLWVARDENRLKILATRISEDTNRSVKVIAADLTNDADLVRVEQVLRTGARIA